MSFTYIADHIGICCNHLQQIIKEIGGCVLYCHLIVFPLLMCLDNPVTGLVMPGKQKSAMKIFFMIYLLIFELYFTSKIKAAAPTFKHLYYFALNL